MWPGLNLWTNFLPETHHDEALETLWSQLAWRQQDIVLFGRRIRQPRLICYQGDVGAAYRYSGLHLQPEPWNAGVQSLRQRVQEFLGTSFNAVLINAYRNGADSMGWHADDEPELGPEPIIASLSLGQVRRFRLRKRDSGERLAISLPPGSLLLMWGKSQQSYQHCLPKTRRPCGLRINLTFRWVEQASTNRMPSLSSA